MKTETKFEKIMPKVGEHLYLQQSTRDYYVDKVKRPYTVISVKKGVVTVQAAKILFPIFHYNKEAADKEAALCGLDRLETERYYQRLDGKRIAFYDTLAEGFEEDPDGKIVQLYWKPKKGMWGTKGRYPSLAFFGKWDYFPYLN